MLYFSKLKIISTILFTVFLTYICFSNLLGSNSLINKKINLGLDLQGGSYLLLEVDNNPVIEKNLQTKRYSGDKNKCTKEIVQTNV